MLPDPYGYDARVMRVVDGDTLILDIDVGFSLTLHDVDCRLLGVDTPELKGDTREAGQAAKAFVERWVKDAEHLSPKGEWAFRVRTFKADHFGRWLVDFYRSDTGHNLNDCLIAAGHAVPFMV